MLISDKQMAKLQETGLNATEARHYAEQFAEILNMLEPEHQIEIASWFFRRNRAVASIKQQLFFQ